MLPGALRLFATLCLAGLVAACGADGSLAPDVRTFDAGTRSVADQRQTWGVTAIDVVVPATLTVSQDPKLRFPRVDIVWWEDPEGDRRAQVADVMLEAVRRATASMRGPVPVSVTLRVNRFHALTPDALENGTRGWHDVNFDIEVRDADGTLLAAERSIDADIRALQGAEARAALARGETQRSRIVNRVSQVLRAWFGQG